MSNPGLRHTTETPTTEARCPLCSAVSGHVTGCVLDVALAAPPAPTPDCCCCEWREMVTRDPACPRHKDAPDPPPTPDARAIAEQLARDMKGLYTHDAADVAERIVSAALTAATAAARRDIDPFWEYVADAYDIESREYFEREAPRNGFTSPLAMAAHHIWKRDPKVDAARREEREACAKVADRWANSHSWIPVGRRYTGVKRVAASTAVPGYCTGGDGPAPGSSLVERGGIQGLAGLLGGRLSEQLREGGFGVTDDQPLLRAWFWPRSLR